MGALHLFGAEEVTNFDMSALVAISDDEVSLRGIHGVEQFRDQTPSACSTTGRLKSIGSRLARSRRAGEGG